MYPCESVLLQFRIRFLPKGIPTVSYPESISIALFDCPHCIDNFAFDYQKIRNLGFRWLLASARKKLQKYAGDLMGKFSIFHWLIVLAVFFWASVIAKGPLPLAV